MAQSNIEDSNLFTQCGEVYITGGDIYKEFIFEKVSGLLIQNKNEFQPKQFVEDYIRLTASGTLHAWLPIC